MGAEVRHFEHLERRRRAGLLRRPERTQGEGHVTPGPTETAPQVAASPAIARKLGLALLVIATAQLMLVLDDVRGYSAMHTGLAYLPYVAGVGLASGGFGPRLLGARHARAVIAAGMIICASGLAWYVMALTPASNYYAVMLPAMLAGGIGTGLTFVGCTVVGMRAVAATDSGIAAGLLNTSVQLGAAIGLAALAAVASTVTSSHLPGHSMAVALTDGYVAGLLTGCVIYTAGALIALATINARIGAAETAPTTDAITEADR